MDGRRLHTSTPSGRRLHRWRVASVAWLADATHGARRAATNCTSTRRRGARDRRRHTSTSQSSMRDPYPHRGNRPRGTLNLNCSICSRISTSAELIYAQNWARLRSRHTSLRIVDNGPCISVTHYGRQTRLLLRHWNGMSVRGDARAVLQHCAVLKLTRARPPLLIVTPCRLVEAATRRRRRPPRRSRGRAKPGGGDPR